MTSSANVVVDSTRVVNLVSEDTNLNNIDIFSIEKES